MDKTSNGEILLKTRAFGGFEKQQVLDYIDKLREDNRKAEQELESKIASISQSRDELSDSVARFEAQIRGLEQQLDEKKEKINELTGVINTLGDEISHHKQTAAEKEKELAAQKEQNRRLTLKAEESIDKARKYSEISSQVGTIIIEARRSASEIIAAAKVAAEDSHSDLLLAARRMADEMTGFRVDIAEMRSTMSRMIEDVNSRISDIESAAGELEQRLANVVVSGADAEEKSTAPTATQNESAQKPDEQREDTPPGEEDTAKADKAESEAGSANTHPESKDDAPKQSDTIAMQGNSVPSGQFASGRSTGFAGQPKRGFLGSGSLFRPR